MKASELIERLQKLPPDIDLGVYDPCENFYLFSEHEIMITNGYVTEVDDDGNEIEVEVPLAMIFTKDADE